MRKNGPKNKKSTRLMKAAWNHPAKIPELLCDGEEKTARDSDGLSAYDYFVQGPAGKKLVGKFSYYASMLDPDRWTVDYINRKTYVPVLPAPGTRDCTFVSRAVLKKDGVHLYGKKQADMMWDSNISALPETLHLHLDPDIGDYINFRLRFINLPHVKTLPATIVLHKPPEEYDYSPYHIHIENCPELRSCGHFYEGEIDEFLLDGCPLVDSFPDRLATTYLNISEKQISHMSIHDPKSINIGRCLNYGSVPPDMDEDEHDDIIYDILNDLRKKSERTRMIRDNEFVDSVSSISFSL